MKSGQSEGKLKGRLPLKVVLQGTTLSGFAGRNFTTQSKGEGAC